MGKECSFAIRPHSGYSEASRPVYYSKKRVSIRFVCLISVIIRAATLSHPIPATIRVLFPSLDVVSAKFTACPPTRDSDS